MDLSCQTHYNRNENYQYVDEYYHCSELYPREDKRENIIITAEMTMVCFEKYCKEKNIDVFNNRSIDAIVAVAMAAKMGNIPLLEGLIKKIGTDILNTCDKNYFTPLYIVCHETRVPGGIYNIQQLCSGAQRLIELGADPNIPSKDGYTPLSTSALKAENLPLTQLLIQKGAKAPALCFPHLKVYSKDGYISAESRIKANINEAFKKNYNIKEEALQAYYNVFF